MDAGAVFRKWDLHVHTPLSYENQYEFENDEERGKFGNDIFEKYIAELEKIKEISCIGITDYFSVEGYRKIRNAMGVGRLKNFELILPNVEFRLDTFVGGKRLNYHVILSDELAPDVIEDQFLSELQVEKPGSEKVRLSREEERMAKRFLLVFGFCKRNDILVSCFGLFCIRSNSGPAQPSRIRLSKC